MSIHIGYSRPSVKGKEKLTYLPSAQPLWDAVSSSLESERNKRTFSQNECTVYWEHLWMVEREMPCTASWPPLTDGELHFPWLLTMSEDGRTRTWPKCLALHFKKGQSGPCLWETGLAGRGTTKKKKKIETLDLKTTTKTTSPLIHN